MIETLEQRIQRLEDIEAIRKLKASYFHCCDRRHIEGIRDCFAKGEILIDYGSIGVFTQRDDFIKVFQEKACHPHIVDMHHGQNAQIEWHNEHEASALWDLYFFQVDSSSSVHTQLAGYYEDAFQKVDGQWKIVKTIFNVCSTQILKIDSEYLQAVYAGAPPK